MKKYEYTGETRTGGALGNVIVRRIRATISFGAVKAGDLGGWIEKDSNLSDGGNAWVDYGATVYGDARVYGDAWVYSNARVYGSAEVYGNARVGGNAEVNGNAEVGGNAGVGDNARVYGDAWVGGNAEVYGDARVGGNAKVGDDARVGGNAEILCVSHLLVVGPVGRRSSFTTFFKDKDNEITVRCGCFLGKIDQFLEKVEQTHGKSRYALVYRACVETAKMQIDLTRDGKEDDHGI